MEIEAMTTKTSKPRSSKKSELNGTSVQSESEVLTLAEAAAFLRVPENGLKADVVDGKVPGRLVAGEWRFSRVGLMCWLGHFETKQLPALLIGKDLVEHIRKIGVPWNAASEREAEALIAAIKASDRSESGK
jgi:hypothetical protein